MAIAFNPEEEYVVTEDNLIVAKPLLESLVEQEVTKGGAKKNFKASILENSYAINPLNGRKSQLILGDHVMMDGGSGLVHTAPGHGEEDYRVGLKYNLEVIMPVDEEGLYDQTVVREGLLPDPESFVGEHVFRANERILECLGESLLKCSKFTHSYPFCWRTHKPVIYRATRQWFIAMDDAKIDGETLRTRARSELENVRFYPESGIKRLGTMIENRPDWCISRQRDWGVAIAFFRDKASGKVIYDEKVLNFIAMIFEQKGADAWWDMEIKDLLYPGSGYEPENLEKVMDILDVWFDSGSTWKAVLESRNYDAGYYPASMYLEGSDQHRGWFQSSLLVSTASQGKAPYNKMLTHGFTVDEKGEKMSKSKGNVVAPSDIAKKYGVEILRLWVGLSDYSTDLKISDNIIKQVSEQYRKIRNTFRFLLASVGDLEELVSVEKMGELDRWILAKAKSVFDEVEKEFREYDFSKGFSLLNHFITVELSGIYLDISKDRLYCNAKDDIARTSTQSAMVMITKRLLGLIAPTLTYTIDEIMEYAPDIVKGDWKDAFDVVYEPLPDVKTSLEVETLIEAREKFFEIVDGLKKEKIIKSTLELVVSTDSDVFDLLKGTDAEDWFTASEVAGLREGEELGEFEVGDAKFKILRATEAKCPRCWKFRAKDETSLCERCEEAMANA